MKHELKILEQYWQEVKSGNKRFEVRLNDRNYKVGDIIEFKPITENGNPIIINGNNDYIITYVLPGGDFGISDAYCVLSIKPKNTGLETVSDYLDHWINHSGRLAIVSDEYYDSIFDAIETKNLNDFLLANETILDIVTDTICFKLEYLLLQKFAKAKVLHTAISWEEKIVILTIETKEF